MDTLIKTVFNLCLYVIFVVVQGGKTWKWRVSFIAVTGWGADGRTQRPPSDPQPIHD